MPHSRINLRFTRENLPASECALDELRDRLNRVLGSQSCRAIGTRTSTNPETVRRYLTNGHPSIEFLIAVIRAYDISANWLLLGIGPPRQSEVLDHSIRSATLSQLLRGISEKLAESERVGRFPGERSTSHLRMTSSASPEAASRLRSSLGAAIVSTST